MREIHNEGTPIAAALPATKPRRRRRVIGTGAGRNFQVVVVIWRGRAAARTVGTIKIGHAEIISFYSSLYSLLKYLSRSFLDFRLPRGFNPATSRRHVFDPPTGP